MVTKKQSHSKEIVSYLVNSFGLKDVNWGFQMKLAKSLLTQYSYMEIIYALNYYKNKGIQIYSLGFLTYKMNMKDPCSMYLAEKNMNEGGNSGERNLERIRQNNQTKHRTEYPIHLFEEPDEDD